MTKTKKAKSKNDEPKLQLIAGGEQQASAKKGKKKGKKADGAGGKHGGGLDSLMKLAEHPLVSDLIAVGALAAVAAIAEAGKNDPASVKSANAAKSAGKAAAAAIGARLLKEMAPAGGGAKKSS